MIHVCVNCICKQLHVWYHNDPMGELELNRHLDTKRCQSYQNLNLWQMVYGLAISVRIFLDNIYACINRYSGGGIVILS